MFLSSVWKKEFCLIPAQAMICLNSKKKDVFFMLVLIPSISFAAPIFSPGQTLDPGCSPIDPDCAISTSTYLTIIGASNAYLSLFASTSLAYIPSSSSVLYVPYTGASTTVDLNGQNITDVSNLIINNANGVIPANSNLIFEFELVNVLDYQLKLDTMDIDKYLTKNSITAMKDASGLRYTIDVAGIGAKPNLSKYVLCFSKVLVILNPFILLADPFIIPSLFVTTKTGL